MSHTVEIAETSQTVTVQSGAPDATSLQGKQLPTNPRDGQVLRFNGATGEWEHGLESEGEWRPHRFSKVAAPLVTIVLDDGTEDHFTDFKPVFDDQGEVAVGAMPSGLIGDAGSLSEAQLKAMEDDGWEIASHSRTHTQPGNLTDEQNEFDEVLGSKEDLEALGIDVRNYVYPFNNSQTREWVQKYYRGARGDLGIAEPNPRPLDLYELHSIAWDTTPLADMKAKVDEAETREEWLIVYFHEATADKLSRLSDIIDYIQSKGIPIVTLDEGLNRARKPFQTGDLHVEQDGKVRILTQGQLVDGLVLQSRDRTGQAPGLFLRDSDGTNIVQINANGVFKIRSDLQLSGQNNISAGLWTDNANFVRVKAGAKDVGIWTWEQHMGVGTVDTGVASTLTVAGAASVGTGLVTTAAPTDGLRVQGRCQFDADVDVPNLPTTDPLVAGRLWNDAGTVKVSSG